MHTTAATFWLHLDAASQVHVLAAHCTLSSGSGNKPSSKTPVGARPAYLALHPFSISSALEALFITYHGELAGLRLYGAPLGTSLRCAHCNAYCKVCVLLWGMPVLWAVQREGEPGVVSLLRGVLFCMRHTQSVHTIPTPKACFTW